MLLIVMVLSPLLSALSLLPLVLALPIDSPVSLDVWAPTITYPTTDTVWSVDGNYTVTWDTSGKPIEITNPHGKIFLRQGDLTEDHPIAQDFLLADGQVNVTVPCDTQPGSDWRVVLMGDSGNWSPSFTIVASSWSS